jgi:hypothetical protein
VSTAHPKPRRPRKRQSKQYLQVAVPVEDVSILLEVLEEYTETIEDSGCDCDDCTRELDVLRAFTGMIVSVSPLANS